MCCKEITATASECETASSDEPVMCITEHGAICLNIWVLQARSMRVTLPSCAMNRVRTKFQSADGQYTGFKYPPH